MALARGGVSTRSCLWLVTTSRASSPCVLVSLSLSPQPLSLVSCFTSQVRRSSTVAFLSPCILSAHPSLATHWVLHSCRSFNNSALPGSRRPCIHDRSSRDIHFIIATSTTYVSFLRLSRTVCTWSLLVSRFSVYQTRESQTLVQAAVLKSHDCGAHALHQSACFCRRRGPSYEESANRSTVINYFTLQLDIERRST
jgi:hypothetical protein